MQDFLNRPLPRRKLLAAAAGAAGAALLRPGGSRVSAAPPAVQVLVEDAVHDGRDFDRGRRSGVRSANGLLDGDGEFESPVIESPIPFTHAGLHWRGGGAASQTSFSVRTSLDGASWTEWQRVLVEAAPDETPRRETYGALVSAPRHRYLQYRTALSRGASVNSVTATFLNSTDGPRLAAAPTALAVVKPPVIDFSREDWGCDESLRFTAAKKVIWPAMFVPVKKLVVHHTVSGLYSDGAAEVRAIYTYHAKTLGWGDIGYAALVDIWGNSYEGRHGRGSGSTREVFSPDVVAGHASAHNYGTCGVAAIGDFETNPVPAALLDRLVEVLTYRARQREVDPHFASAFLQSGGLWTANLGNVCGHKDCNATLCPGQHLYPLLGSIRDQIATALETSGSPILTPPRPTLTGPDGIKTSNRSLSYSWTGAAGLEYSYYLEGWSKSSSSENIGYLRGYDSARYPVWSGWSTETKSASYGSLSDGHYSMHVRSRDANGKVSYQSNKTVLIARR